MRIALFGGSGGLGSKLTPYLKEKYEVLALGSKDVQIENEQEVSQFFAQENIDIVINMAVVSHNAMLHKLDEDCMKKQLDVNILGAANILKHCLPKMREKNFGRIILTSSILSKKPVQGAAIYSGCKAFIDNLVKTAALENAKYNITCNSIVLGYCDGGLAHKLNKTFLEEVINSIPLKRLGAVKEIYQAIDFLIETEYITAANLPLTGGL